MATQSFGSWLLAELEQRDWSQGELARRAKIEPSHISRMISGQRKPGLDALRGIAAALRLSLDDVSQFANEGLPIKPQNNHVRQRRIVYEANAEERLLELWRGLSPDDRRRMLDLMERLTPAVEPRIIGDEATD